MNKNQLLKNHDSAVNASALRNSMINKRVIVIGSPLNSFKIEQIRPYFDIIIAVGQESANYCKNPDIIILKRNAPYNESVLDLRIYDEYKQSILCINIEELNILVKTNNRHKNYVLAWSPSDQDASVEPISICGISYGLNNKDPGGHLAQIGGSSDIFSSNIMKENFEPNIAALMKEKIGYKPKYILRPIRTNFVNEAVFCD